MPGHYKDDVKVSPSLKDIIKTYRKRNNLTQLDFCLDVGVSPRLLYEIESGQKDNKHIRRTVAALLLSKHYN